MLLLDLNEDVLSEIVSYLSTQQALNLMLTTRSLLFIAERQVSSIVAIGGLTGIVGRLMKFCTYMLANGACRLAHLRSLNIFMLPSDFQEAGEEARICARLLASLLEKARNLRRLALAAVEALLKCEPRIGIAIASHPVFSQLALHDLGERSMEVLRNLRSQPRKVEVHTESSFSDFYALFSSISSLQQMATLTLDWDCRRSVMLAAFPNDLKYTWPAVRQLEVVPSGAKLSPIVRAFPNVRFFNMAGVVNIPGNTLGNFWPLLDYLRGYPKVLTGLSISCPVHFLCLTPILGRNHQWDISEALLFIRNVSPAVLAIVVTVSGMPNSFWTELVHNAPNLHSIHIALSADSRDQGLESVMAAWMDTVPATLAALSRLVHLELYISSHDQIYPLPKVNNFAQQIFGLHPSRHTSEKYPNMLVKRIPSLRQLAVGYGDMEFHRSPDEPPFVGTYWWWKAIDVDGERTLETMNADVGERIRAKLNTSHARRVVE